MLRQINSSWRQHESSISRRQGKRLLKEVKIRNLVMLFLQLDELLRQLTLKNLRSRHFLRWNLSLFNLRWGLKIMKKGKKIILVKQNMIQMRLKWSQSKFTLKSKFLVIRYLKKLKSKDHFQEVLKSQLPHPLRAQKKSVLVLLQVIRTKSKSWMVTLTLFQLRKLWNKTFMSIKSKAKNQVCLQTGVMEIRKRQINLKLKVNIQNLEDLKMIQANSLKSDRHQHKSNLLSQKDLDQKWLWKKV